MSTLTEEIRRGKTITAIARNRGVSRATIYTKLKSSGVNHQKLKFNHNFFEDVNCEEKAYWLGFIMADGCVSLTQSPKVAIGLNKKDELHLKKWHKALKSCLKIHYCGDRVASSHSSAKMCQDLIRLGCIPRKSLQLKFPSLREDLIRHFVRGYFDGDGCISWHNKHQKTFQIRFTIIGTKAFLDQLQIILKTSNRYTKRGKAYVLSICGNQKAGLIFQWMYDDSTIFLDRKREIYIAQL